MTNDCRLYINSSLISAELGASGNIQAKLMQDRKRKILLEKPAGEFMFDKSHFPYLPHTEEDRQKMLAQIGVSVFEDLLSHIPAEIRAKELNLPSGLSELELSEELGRLAERNVSANKQSSFLGGGALRRYVPAAVSSIVSRSEFATAYTPYQPEVSQGTLQAIYEFQTAVCLLTGMEVANASLYDGPTACAEAALMACRITGRAKIVLAQSVNPEYRLVSKTYAQFCELEHGEIIVHEGALRKEDCPALADVAAIVVQYPNYFGVLEDIDEIGKLAHENGALLVVVSDPVALAALTTPGALGADIVVGDAQQCGNGLSFGGPSAGYLATKMQFVRQVPGRLCGLTKDNRGNQAFTLTLQAREQHIRRAKATSNICTNQALNALTMLVYLSFMGPKGLYEVCNISISRAHYLASLLSAIPGVQLAFDKPFLNEFVIKVDAPAQDVLLKLKEEGILGGINLQGAYPELKDCILVSVTEMNGAKELTNYAQVMQSVMQRVIKSNPGRDLTAAYAANKSAVNKK